MIGAAGGPGCGGAGGAGGDGCPEAIAFCNIASFMIALMIFLLGYVYPFIETVSV